MTMKDWCCHYRCIALSAMRHLHLHHGSTPLSILPLEAAVISSSCDWGPKGSNNFPSQFFFSFLSLSPLLDVSFVIVFYRSLHQPHSVFLFQSQLQMAWVRNNKNQPFCLLQVSHIPPLPLMVTDHSFPFCLSVWPPFLTFCLSLFLPIIMLHCNFITWGHHQHKIEKKYISSLYLDFNWQS